MRRALAAGWQVAAAPAGTIADPSGLAAAALTWHAATAPTTAAGALRAAGVWSFDTPRAFDAEDWWWRVAIDDAPLGELVLGLDGIATLYDVWWNGAHVRAGSNMFVATRDRVVARGGDTLVIRCRALDAELAKKRPRPRWRVPMIEQQQLRFVRTTLLGRTPGWSPPCPPVGPWRDVWIAPARGDASDLGDPHIATRFDDVEDVGVVRVVAPLAASVARAILVVARGDKRVEVELARDATGAWAGEALIHRPVRWWPHTHGEPARYDVALVVDDPHSAPASGGAARSKKAGPCGVPRSLGATGFRTVTLEREGGDFALRVNGVRVFCRGACWTPLDPVTLAASPAALEAAIAQVRDAGLNTIRVGGTMVYEDAAFLDALDRHGVLLWQDLMFANMDYPDDAALRASIDDEVAQQLAHLAAHPCVAMICGNSEGGQQAAMAGATRDRWTPALFHEHLRDRAAAALPDVPYVASSTDGGAYPHQVDAGTTSYYGVGAYLRGLDDARRSGLRFASEALAFANLPRESGLPGGAGLRVHHALWKARSPRDLGAGWDFDDVRDHYVEVLFGVDPVALRTSDHDRYLALGRFATGEVMARAFAEWRRAGSPTRGALVWFLRDLWPGAGWGLVDAHGDDKPCLHAVRRACAPIALAITDEGNNGLALHVANDPPHALALAITATLYRGGEIVVARGTAELAVAGHAAAALPLAALFEGWYDLSYAFRFGPPQTDAIHVRAVDTASGAEVGETFAFPVGLPASELDVGLVAATASEPHVVEVTARRFAFGVTIDAPGWRARDTGFHVPPGETRRVAMVQVDPAKPLRGTVVALNAETRARFG